MSIINSIFGSKAKAEKSQTENWEHLEDMNQLENLTEVSFTIPVTIFKHSTRCNISSFSLRQFERSYNIPADKMKLYFLDLLAYRAISNEISVRFGVAHQSPQVLVIKDGKAVYDASHENIHAEDLVKFAE
ncbi:bacillithiol system redox-active protein YtxJ [Flavobacterium pallidum]|uniref:Bacillithiol system redox-active protein YtxJ n=1 Tax=Flavobacterium pallidum TaxID=2172098 RepID=A0A2S1SI13_9FLAO|nr:bacillithiol system redox-active protein YtxJ [Flavobacterium pallidum]AWI25982.1 bacillithiol system redox-active protein YtxJ [Flavobacterium pallidum]